MKIAFSLALLVAFVFSTSACSTLSNRRELYKPEHAKGPWAKRGEKVRHQVWHNKILDY